MLSASFSLKVRTLGACLADAGIPRSPVKPAFEGVGEIPHLQLDPGPDIVARASLALGQALQPCPNVGRPLLQFRQVAGGLNLLGRRTRGQRLLLSSDLRTELMVVRS